MDELLGIDNDEIVCRLCLSTEEPISSIFDDRTSAVSLVTKIQSSLSIEIQISDKLSTFICANCIKRVNEWHIYKEACLRSQEKLQRCFRERMETLPNIKMEPMDVEDPVETFETVPLTSDEEWEDLPDLPVNACLSNVSMEMPRNGELKIMSPPIKKEPTEEDNENVRMGKFDSVYNRELLLNPMAVGSSKDDRLIELDTTKKLEKRKNLTPGGKKKMRRGPKTHYTGTRRYKQRCSFCQIYLHSKYSYAKHMERFHSGKIVERRTRTKREIVDKNTLQYSSFNENFDEEAEAEEEEEEEFVDEMIEDVEDELISLEKDAPLTPVQQNIISQLKTFSCYSCELSFQDRRTTLNHIRQHMPDLRPYTCIACLTEFADRSIYKLHCGASFQCAMKIALVTPKIGTEKYFTCNMCLRPLANRKELLSHLSKHSDKQYEQMMAGPFDSPPKLKPMTSLTSTPMRNREKNSPTKRRNIVQRISDAPYQNGDPAHNHTCIYCGMIYRYKQNMLKHVVICKKLPAIDRISYRCAECGLTFLALKKLQSHLSCEHKKTREFVCYHCKMIFQDSQIYSEHYKKHRVNHSRGFVKINNNDKDKTIKAKRNTVNSLDKDKKGGKINLRERTIFSCAICPGSSFSSRYLLAEHRKSHLKMKNYSCTICRRIFGRATALESHMATHDMDVNISEFDLNSSIPLAENQDKLNLSMISDPGTSNTECHTCGKVFANYPNLRRHIRTVHDAIGRYSCFTCAKTFKSEEIWSDHMENNHKNTNISITCPQCPEEFYDEDTLEYHRRNIHGINQDDHLACYICGKKFANETSLRIHRGHHFRVNSRLSIGNDNKKHEQRDEKIIAMSKSMHDVEKDSTMIDESDETENLITVSPVKSPRARKSFPNNSSAAKKLLNILQCQVCDDRFPDVSTLRKHLWDVHCARNKPEKVYQTEKLECELCTNVLPDEESLASHMNWHENNPILSNVSRSSRATPMKCDICGKFYSGKANLWKHKKRHKVRSLAAAKMQPIPNNNWGGRGFTCNVCRKIFATKLTMKKHKISAHPETMEQNHDIVDKVTTKKATNRNGGKNNNNNNRNMKNTKMNIDFDTLIQQVDFSGMEMPKSNSKKPVTCVLCRKIVPGMRALYKHRQVVHKIVIGKAADKPDTKLLASVKMEKKNEVTCTACNKIFSNLSNMKQHFTKVHGPTSNVNYRCTVEGCKLTYKSLAARQAHEKTHINVMYTCSLCPRHMLNREAMADHMLTAHKSDYSTGNSKMLLCKKVNLDNYVVKGAIGRECPICKITYPNYKAMKIHYLKVHEVAT